MVLTCISKLAVNSHDDIQLHGIERGVLELVPALAVLHDDERHLC